MKNIIIPVHSFIDVITNSSTEIFVKTKDNSKLAMHEVINKILKRCGSDKKSEDLFKIKIEDGDAYYEDSWRMYQNLKPEMLSDTTYTKYFTAHRVGPHRGVRTDRCKLIEYYTEGDYWELFELQTDPHELRNLYGEVVYKDITSELKKELRRLQKLYRIVEEA